MDEPEGHEPDLRSLYVDLDELLTLLEARRIANEELLATDERSSVGVLGRLSRRLRGLRGLLGRLLRL